MPKLPLRTKILLIVAVVFGLATIIKLVLEQRRSERDRQRPVAAPAELRPAPAPAPPAPPPPP